MESNPESGIGTAASNHGRDEDCVVSPLDNLCVTCGVERGDPCVECGGCSFHRQGCPEIEPVYVYSMGARFRLRAIFTDTEKSNAFMEANDDVSLFACLGEYQLIADSIARKVEK